MGLGAGAYGQADVGARTRPPAPALLAGWRQLLPDYRRTAMIDWVLHGGWVAVAVALVAVESGRGRRSRRPSRSSPGATPLQPMTDHPFA